MPIDDPLYARGTCWRLRGWRCWLAAAAAQTLDKVSFGTNWVAEAEHGGFYQAVADGTYAKYGLDVTIVSGRAAGQQSHPAAGRQARLLS